MDSPILSINNLTVRFKTDNDSILALDHICLHVQRGKTLGIVGESGSGKSVTSLAVMGLLPMPPAEITEGSIFYTGKNNETIDLLSLKEKKRRNYRGKEIAMIFQEPMTSLNPVYTCGKQVMEAIMLDKNVHRKQAKERVLSLFDEVKLSSPKRISDAYPHELSGGQKQRVMIAMALSRNPSLLIADEPTTALDVTVQKSILKLLDGLQDKYGMAIIFISHDLGIIAELADRVAVMHKGIVVECNNIENIFSSPAHPYTQGLIACRPPVNIRLKQLPVISDFINEAQSGDQTIKEKHEFKALVISSKERDERLKLLYTPPPILEVKEIETQFVVNKNWAGKPKQVIPAVDKVTFSVFEGETLGLVGESGCGKTTLGRTILRLVNSTSGNIIYKGREITHLRSKEMRLFRKNMQIIFQDPYSSLNPRISAGAAITEPMKVHDIIQDSLSRKQKAIDLLCKVGLNDRFFDRYPHEMSGGQRQRIAIARALALKPEFIILDESVSALDVSVQAQVLNLLNELKEEYKFTYIFISHDLSVVKFMSDRIIVMKNGRIEEQGDAEKIYFHPEKEYTRTLIASIPEMKTAKSNL